MVYPLFDLNKKGCPEWVIWDEHCARFLEKIKELISCEPTLLIPNIKNVFSSRQTPVEPGWGVCCSSGWMVFFVLAGFLPRETRYAVIKREALAIDWGLQKLSCFLIGIEFVLQTDYAPMRCLVQGKPQNARLCRWAFILQQFNFTVEYIHGVNNTLADYLSRVA